MSNYTQNVSYAPKDALTQGDPNKAILGSQIDAEFSEISTAIASKEDVANKGQPSGYVPLSALSFISDSYLTSNIPRLNSTAIFASGLTVSGPAPEFRMRETDGAADEQYWIWVYTVGSLSLRAYNDTFSSSVGAITIERTGTTLDSINLAATTVTVNGVSVNNAAILTAGTLPDARFPGTLPVASGVNLTALNASNLASGTVPDARLNANPPFTTIELGHASDTTLSRVASGRVAIEGIEIGYRQLPGASVTAGAFAAADQGKCVYATAGVTIPNSTMAANDVVIIQNTTGAGVTITKTITTAYNTGTGSALGATFTLNSRGRCSIVFTSATECYVSGNIA